MATTTLKPTIGLPGQPYGSFSGKQASTPAAATTITQLMPHAGLPGRRYSAGGGSFSGKEPSAGTRRRGGSMMGLGLGLPPHPRP